MARKKSAVRKTGKAAGGEPFKVGNIVDKPLRDELAGSFIEYAMSVIVSRALPDVRDGLKPVQRRLMYSMYDLGIAHPKPHRKSARIVGDVVGKYHPHGDSAIYDAMVRMAQDWVMNTPLVDGQGNFGSADDRQAAMRYTESRLSEIGAESIADLGEGVVDFGPTYDDSGTEPLVLPVRFPNLLVNGAQGIAVGVATSIAPHNLREVVGATQTLLKDPDASTKQLMRSVKGPDFPSGGFIVDDGGLLKAYETGRGAVRVRGRATIEDAVRGRGKAIVITEFPYNVGPEKFVTKAVDAVRAKKVDGVAAIADHTDRHSGVRVVITLKRGVNPQAVIQQLYKYTPLEDRFNFNQVALIRGVPHTLGLKAMLKHFIEFQVEIIVRRTEYRLDKASKRLRLIDGLLVALDDIDNVVAIIRKSRTTDTAHKNLKTALKLDDTQIRYILEMPLRRLTGLEVRKLKDEAKGLRADVKGYNSLLRSEKLQRQMVADDLRAFAGKYGQNRRTVIVDAGAEEVGVIPESVEITAEPCTITVTRDGKIGRDEGGRRTAGRDDVLSTKVHTTLTSEMFFVTNKGVAHRVLAHEVPVARGKDRGVPGAQLFELEPGEHVVGAFSSSELDEGKLPVFATRHGVVKRVRADDLSKMREVVVMTLDDSDEIVLAQAGDERCEVAFITRQGQLLRTAAGKIRPQGRGAGGVVGIRLRDEDDLVIAADLVGQSEQGSVVVVADSGRAKASEWDAYPVKGRGGAGVRTIRFLKGDTMLVDAGVFPIGSWAYLDERGKPLGVSGHVKRDASGDVVEGVVSVGMLRAGASYS